MLEKILLLTVLYSVSFSASAQSRGMQHGFILAESDHFASHLVANGHHSRQVELTGQLIVEDRIAHLFYESRKNSNRTSHASYFLFQAQDLDLVHLKDRTRLRGHITEMPIGNYTPENIIVADAFFEVSRILINIPNPFFAE